MSGSTFLLCLAIAYILQVFLTNYQLSLFRKSMMEMAQNGPFIVGRKKGILNGTAVIINFSSDGTVLEARGMKGATVFTRLHKISDWTGKTPDELLIFLKNTSWEASVKNAFDSMEKQVEVLDV